MVNGKGVSKPYISFIGNSATDVTGSMHLVRFKKYVTLLDCGLIQLNAGDWRCSFTYRSSIRIHT